MEGAAVEEKRIFRGVDRRIDDLADEDDVVTAVVFGPRTARQGGCVSDERGREPGVVPYRLGALGLAGEMQCGVQLVGGQYVHGEGRAAEVGAGLRLPRQRHLAQAGLHRDGCEGGNCRPVWSALGVVAGDHRDAAGELAEDVSKCSLVHHESPSCTMCVIERRSANDDQHMARITCRRSASRRCDPHCETSSRSRSERG